MLKLNKHLKAKRLEGRKYRSPFYLCALFAAAVIFAAAWVAADLGIPAREGKGVINTLIAMLAAAIPFMLAMAGRHVVCVIGPCELYFFAAEVKKKKKDQKSESTASTNGMLLYSDIREIEFLPAGFERSYGGRSLFDLRLPHICICGEDFTVTFPARRALIKRINEKRDEIVFVGGIPEDAAAPEKPTGLWGEILAAFEDGAFERGWPSDMLLEDCTYDMDGETVDITLTKGEAAACFSIDKENLFVYDTDSDRDINLTLSQFADKDALLAYMKEQAEAILH